MEGALINVCAYDQTDDILYKYNKKRAYSYTTHGMKKCGDKLYEHTLSRIADKCNIIGLTVLRKSIENLDVPIIDIECRIGGTTVYQIPYEVIKELYKVNYIDETTIIMCDLNMFIKDIPLIRLAFHEVQLIVHVENSDNIERILVRTEYLFIEGDERKEFARRPTLNQPIQYLEHFEVKKSDEESSYGIIYKSPISIKGRTKGFLINCNVDNIKGLKMRFGYTLSGGEVKMYDYAMYDFAMLDHLCTRISDDMLYLPFNKNVNYKDTNVLSFDGSVSFNKLDKSEIDIITRTPVDTINVYGLCFNLLKTESGMSTILYDKKPEKVHNDYNDIKRWKCVNLPLEVTTESHKGSVYYKCDACNEVILDDVCKYFNDTGEMKCPKCSNDWTNWIRYCNSPDSTTK